MRLAETKAIVTGGASGLGRATAEGLIAAGAAVEVFDLGGEAPEGAGLQRLDVTDGAAAAQAVAAAQERMGGLTALVNCAGIAFAEKTLGREGPHDLARFETAVAVNLTGSFNVARLAAAAMAANAPDADGQRGVIVHTASVAAFEGQKGQVAYAASKGGIAGLVLPMARDLAREGIRVVGLAPGIFRTPMLEGLGEEVMAGLAADVPNPPRLGDPAEFAQAVRFCLECGYLNGTVIRLDGALRMR
jgi:NAD(P)-dependent dehydrogenase (short-subunit alcohol dehydrogenase family)